MDITTALSRYEPVTESGCWIWLGALSTYGYARVWLNNKQVAGHRLFYEQMKGCIPDGLDIDHLCRVRCCVNPDHMEPVTNRENILRGTNFAAKNAKKTHCPSGHEYSVENTYIVDRGRGFTSRHCRACARDAAKEAYHARRNSSSV